MTAATTDICVCGHAWARHEKFGCVAPGCYPAAGLRGCRRAPPAPPAAEKPETYRPTTELVSLTEYRLRCVEAKIDILLERTKPHWLLPLPGEFEALTRKKP